MQEVATAVLSLLAELLLRLLLFALLLRLFLCFRAGVVERSRLLPFGLESRPRLRVPIEVDKLAIDDSSTASLSSYCGLDKADRCGHTQFTLS